MEDGQLNIGMVEKIYEEKNENTIIAGVLGNVNKGKSFFWKIYLVIKYLKDIMLKLKD